MIKKVNKFAKELRQHIDSTYDELNNNVKGINMLLYIITII